MPILTDQERLGTTIGDGKYTLERVLGRGGMGTVFEGCHTWTGRRVAVKLLRHDMASDLGASQRFLQEARSATAIEHPNVVEVLDMGRHDESTVYMVFELLRGESLADRLENTGPLDAMQAAMILLPVADALAAAHRLGIVHRDVKPENIFLEDDGMGYVRPKLLDFGVARISERGSGSTRTGVVVGTPGYLSPEHAQGFRAVPASDVWSLGVVLFECVAGYCPFERDSVAAAILAIVSQPIPSLRELSYVPEPIVELVELTLVRDPASRFPDGAAFRDALALASQVEFVPSRSRSVPPKILLDSGEISLSNTHQVEGRQSSPHLLSSMPALPTPTPLPERLGATSAPQLYAGVVVPLKSEHLPTLDSVPAFSAESPGRTAPPTAPATTNPAEDGPEEVMTSASSAAVLPRSARRRRAAMFALPVLLLLFVTAMAYRATRTEGPRVAGGEATSSAMDSAAMAPTTTSERASELSALPSERSRAPSAVAAPVASAPVVAPTAAAAAAAAEWSPDAPPLGASTRAAATEPGVREQAGSGRESASDTRMEAEPAATRPAPSTRRSQARQRPEVERGANGSLILD